MCNRTDCNHNAGLVQWHNHTHFSLNDAYATPEELAEAGRRRGYLAMGISDHGRMGGIPYFAEACTKPMGDLAPIKPILGMEAYVVANRLDHTPAIHPETGKKVKPKNWHLSIWAINEIGMRNLQFIQQDANEKGFYWNFPRTDESVLFQHSEGLFVASGCMASQTSQLILKGDIEGARQVIRRYKEVFGDRYVLEVMNHGHDEDPIVLDALATLSREEAVPCMATNDVHYIDQKDWIKHDWYWRLQHRTAKKGDEDGGEAEGGKAKAYGTKNFHLRTYAEMCALFDGTALAEAVPNTVRFAEMVENYYKLDVPHLLPHAHIPMNDEGFVAFRQKFKRLQYVEPNVAYLEFLAVQGLARKGLLSNKVYQARLKYELKTIAFMGVTDYFLNLLHILKYMQDRDILFGPRGSAMGSLVLWCLGISPMDPIKYNMMFERFLNPGRGTQYRADVAAAPSKAYLGENGRLDQAAAVDRLKAVVAEKCQGEDWDPMRYTIEKEIWVLEAQALATYVCDLADKGVKVEKNESNLWMLYLLGITEQKPTGDLIVTKVATLPDVDIDADDRYRGDLIAHVQDTWDKKDEATGERTARHVATVGAYQTYGSKAAIKNVLLVSDKFNAAFGTDAARVAQEVSNLVPKKGQVPASLMESVEMSPDFAAVAREWPEEFEAALWVEGRNSAFSQHAAAVVVSSMPLAHSVPLYRSSSGMLATEYDKDMVERLGIVKYDLLGLKLYQKFARAIEYIRETKGIEIGLDTIPLEDPDTFAMLRAGRTASVFQFEGPGMTDALKQVQADCLEDLIAVAALYRPGPMAYIPDYARGKFNPERVKFSHEIAAKHLGVTYGIMVYQEQAMDIVREMAGLDFVTIDKLRKAISKKSGKDFADMMALFKERALARGIPESVINELQEMMATFGQYAFNRAHAGGYGMAALHTAWLKRHFTSEWLGACIQVDKDGQNSKKDLAVLAGECRNLRITVAKPSLNTSGMEVKVATDGKIHMPLTSLDSVGDQVAPILAERDAGGVYADLRDLAFRARPNRGVVEALCRGGALACLPDARGKEVEEVMGLFDEFVADRKFEEKQREREARAKYRTVNPLERRQQSEGGESATSSTHTRAAVQAAQQAREQQKRSAQQGGQQQRRQRPPTLGSSGKASYTTDNWFKSLR